MSWTGIVVTCPYEHWCTPLQQELEGRFESELFLVVPDPDTTSDGVGSGGATLNALLVAVEHLSARRGHSTVVSEILHESLLLILHLGPSILPLPTGLMPLGDATLPRSNLEKIVSLASRLVKGSKKGVLVAGTDILLSGSLNLPSDFRLTGDVNLLTVPSEVEHASNHGVTFSRSDGIVTNILYQPDSEYLNKLCCGLVNLVGGLVWFSSTATETLLNLHCVSPLDACTYMGIDSGEPGLRISLYFDILIACCPDVLFEDFVAGKCGKTMNKPDVNVSPSMIVARKHVWTQMRKFQMRETVLHGLNHTYLPPCRGFRSSGLVNQWKLMSPLSYRGYHLVSSENESLTVHSSVSANKRCALSFGKDHEEYTYTEYKMMELCADPVEVHYFVRGTKIKGIFSMSDRHYEYYKSPTATFLGLPWCHALSALNLSPESVWDQVPEQRRCLHTANLFSLEGRLESLQFLASNHQIEQSFTMNRQICQNILCTTLAETGEFPGAVDFSDVFTLAFNQNWSVDLLHTLDELALESVARGSGAELTGRLAFLMAMTADLLGMMAQGHGGLRSGPANNKDFSVAFRLLEEGRYTEGLNELKSARAAWLDRPVRLVRAARHYEGVVQLLVRKTVSSAEAQIKVDISQSADPLPMNKEVVVRCPARLDLSGAWTDTPPICYEMGGKVVDVALTLNGKKPIGCNAKRIPELVVEVVEFGAEALRLEHLSDLDNHCNPRARGALAKCCLIATKLLDIKSSETLEQQLHRRLGSGLRLEPWSHLPQGSGLGTSSILAGALIAAVWRTLGAEFSPSDVVHAVLVVEQLLTTGGGWQDQVGGLYPGLNLGSSPSNPQVSVNIHHLEPSSRFLSRLEDRLFVLFTGKPRLAKNILQNVVRNWFSRDQRIVQCFKDNYKLAERAVEAVKQEDLDELGACLSECFAIKKILAPGSEPELVKQILHALQPYSRGGILAGAGGGGFLAAILKDDVSVADAEEAVHQVPGGEGVQFYRAGVDLTGITVELSDV